MKFISQIIIPNGNFPNNPILPVLLYKNVLTKMSPKETVGFFQKNQWVRGWINGMYAFHHYHSNTHEALGICNGTCLVQLGGEGDVTMEIEKHDVLILPAGVAHKRLKSSVDFVCVGVYPIDIQYDMKEIWDNPQESANLIMQVPLPQTDPVYGDTGPLLEVWK